MSIQKYPTTERRKCGKRKWRWFVVGVPQFKACERTGFKSEQSLMRCYGWWYHNAFEKDRPAKEAKRQWRQGGRKDYYDSIEFAYEI